MKLPKYRPAKPTQPVGILTNCITYGTNALNIYPKSYPARQSGRNDFAFGVKEMYICIPFLYDGTGTPMETDTNKQ